MDEVTNQKWHNNMTEVKVTTFWYQKKEKKWIYCEQNSKGYKKNPEVKFASKVNTAIKGKVFSRAFQHHSKSPRVKKAVVPSMHCQGLSQGHGHDRGHKHGRGHEHGRGHKRAEVTNTSSGVNAAHGMMWKKYFFKLTT